MKLILKKDQKLFFTSDTHYQHSQICSATSTWKDPGDTVRQFNSLEDMNRALVSNINSKVGPNDVLIHLGDWSFGGFEMIEEFRNQILCENIHLVLGNHDHHIKNNKQDIQYLFSTVHSYLDLDLRISRGKLVDKYRFVCMHYPIASWDGMNYGVIHLHGHVHLPSHLRVGKGKSLDVGVDGNNLNPYSLDEVLNLMENQPIDKLVLPQDHHVKRL
jgi:calcineurin-like phosphoesterase family protein